jgi:hypothetical protein
MAGMFSCVRWNWPAGELNGFSIISVLIQPLLLLDGNVTHNTNCYLRAECIDAHASWCTFESRNFGQANERMFGGDISGDACGSIVTGDAADVDNGAAVLDDFHLRLEAVERADNIDVE